ncbi:hypothetical protein Q7A53_16545 [Halobacillus rhizosphaerae]|uniref:hypothetical protein n=1 Tax=Halobacillus rhizosphaerae TaxID=3064889 RepID=UPI00398A876F
MILIALAVLRYLLIADDLKGYAMTAIGFIMVSSYLYFLEAQSGLSKRFITMKSFATGALFVVISAVFFMNH